jgi:uncharacterized protein (TIGR03067 family)
MLRKSLLIPAWLIVSAGILGAEDDADRFRGNWIVLSHMNNDRKSSDEKVMTMKVIIKGQTLTLTAGAGKMDIPFKLDPSKHPKAVDLDLEEHSLKGIYQLQDDILKIAWNNKGDRPKAFPTKPKDGTGMFVLKRVTDK